MPGSDPWSGEVGGELCFTATPLVAESANYVRFLGLFSPSRWPSPASPSAPPRCYARSLRCRPIRSITSARWSESWYLCSPASSRGQPFLVRDRASGRALDRAQDRPRPLRFLPVVPLAVICVLACAGYQADAERPAQGRAEGAHRPLREQLPGHQPSRAGPPRWNSEDTTTEKREILIDLKPDQLPPQRTTRVLLEDGAHFSGLTHGYGTWSLPSRPRKRSSFSLAPQKASGS